MKKPTAFELLVTLVFMLILTLPKAPWAAEFSQFKTLRETVNDLKKTPFNETFSAEFLDNLKQSSHKILKRYSVKINSSNISRKDSGGAMDGGGGQSIVFKNGQVRFVDTLFGPIKNGSIAKSEEIESVLYDDHIYVRQLAHEAPNFFSCAEHIFHMQKSEALKVLGEKIKLLHPLFVEFRLTGLDRKELPNALRHLIDPIPLIAGFSERFDSKSQEPVAAYQKSRLWISKRIYQRMSSFDQCALQVHEALRHLNHIAGDSTPLETKDIEAITMYVMGISTAPPQKLIQIEQAFEVNTGSAYSQALELHELAKFIGEISFRNRDRLSVQTVAQLEDLFWSLLNASSRLNASAINTKIRNITDSLDTLSSPSVTLLELYIQETGLWNAKTGKRIW